MHMPQDSAPPARAVPAVRPALALLPLLALLLAGCAEPQAARSAPSEEPQAPFDPAAVEGDGGDGGAGSEPPSEAPAGGSDGGTASGGRVLNAPPRVVAFSGSLDRADNGGGSVEVFRATVADDNAEGDLAGLRLVGEGPTRFELARDLTSADLQRRADQSPGPDGWAVWDAAPKDGVLQFSARFTYPFDAPPGDYTWTLTVWDRAGDQAASAPEATRVEPVNAIEVVGAVDQDGAPAPADGWGGWAAPPGAQHVPSTTFLKVANKGADAGTRFLVDFDARDFVGQSDASWRVPLHGNVRFGWWEAEPEQVPRDGDFAWGQASRDGSVTLTFQRLGTVMFVRYEVLDVPTPLPSQVYLANATVTAL